MDPNSPVRDVMAQGALTAEARMTLRSLAAALADLDIGVALVSQAGGSVGIVSEHDVVRALAMLADDRRR